jgi:hypothetical protein
MRALVLALVIFATAAGAAEAAEWRAIRPGESTQNAVREQFGQPTKVTTQKIEGYDSTHWVYEDKQAPNGMTRLTVDFGILTPQGYRPEIVRQMLLEPHKGIFTRRAVTDGWGEPDQADVEGEAKVLRYRSGLFVYFDKEGWIAERMYFTPPQPSAGGGSPPQR